MNILLNDILLNDMTERGIKCTKIDFEMTFDFLNAIFLFKYNFLVKCNFFWLNSARSVLQQLILR